MSFVTSPYEADTPDPPVENGSLRRPAPQPSPVDSPSASSGPRIEKRLNWLDLPADAYPGFKVRVWTNYPARLARQITSSEEGEMIDALTQIVVEHNGWLDFDGTPYPAATDRGERCSKEHPEDEECPGLIREGFWDAIPNELAAAVLALLRISVGKLATSLARPRRGR